MADDSSMFGFQWHVTDACTQRCVHCYQERFDEGSDLGIDALMTLADRVVDSMPRRAVTINLTGGEPLARPWIARLLDHLDAKPNVEALNVITNAMCKDEALLDRVAAVRKLSMFKVSVESADPQVNDSIRGRGSLARLERRLPLYTARRPVALMVTLGRHNACGIREMVDFAGSVGARGGVIFERFVPMGTGAGARELCLDAAGWRAAVEAIVEAAGFEAGADIDLDDLHAFEAFWLHPPAGQGGAGAGASEGGASEPLIGAYCNLGGGSMALMPDGTVYPCRRLPIPCGNALEEPFEAILERLCEWDPARTAARLRGQRCGRCGVVGCSGCRALARALTGDALADDTLCSAAVVLEP